MHVCNKPTFSQLLSDRKINPGKGRQTDAAAGQNIIVLAMPIAWRYFHLKHNKIYQLEKLKYVS
jgi:hypothetical protein